MINPRRRRNSASPFRSDCANLDSITRSQDAVRRLFRVTRDPRAISLSGVFPDTWLPSSAFASDDEREPSLTRRGFPPPQN